MRLSENRCVCCNAVIPEGRQVCRKCEIGTDNNVGSMNDLIAALKRAFKLYHEDMFAIGLVKDAMFDTGVKYCVKKKYEISVTALDDLINEIIVKELRKNENG